jgi:hypothetical protein
MHQHAAVGGVPWVGRVEAHAKRDRPGIYDESFADENL